MAKSQTATTLKPDSESVQESYQPASIGRDELFHILRNQRRRFALHHLKHCEDAVDVGELATQIAA
jgi:hypothetical protein